MSNNIMSNSNSDDNKNKKYDLIAIRLGFIKELLKNKKLEPMIEFENCETEKMISHNNHNHPADKDCNDIRCVLSKRIINFQKVITQIGGKLLYIKSGATGHTFKGIIAPNPYTSINYAVKIVAYPKKENYGDMHDIKRPENAELLMIRVLSYFVVNRQTPHIVLPIGTFNTSIEPFILLSQNDIIKNKKYDEFVSKFNKGEYYSEVSVLISEWANGGDLYEYIKNNSQTFKIKYWRTLFFQILSVLAIIQNKYPSFRHNDLKVNNILVQKIDSDKTKNNKFYHYINDQEYVVPNINIHVKLWDFDFATIPGIVDNAKVEADWTDRINVKPKKNRYYDVHYFFNTLTQNGFFPHFFDSSHVPQEVKEFVRRVVPAKYATGKNVSEKGRILINKEFTTPDIILKTDPFFAKFRLKQRSGQEYSHDNSDTN